MLHVHGKRSRVKVAAGRVLSLSKASEQAYVALESLEHAQSPPGYEILDTWTGLASTLTGTWEPFGVVYRSIKPPYSYIVAIRGTDSVEDLLDDLEAKLVPFVPHGADEALPGVRVEEGFYNVYASGRAGRPSMQAQLFQLLDGYAASDKPVHELLVTGHSLGAAISELFTLDVALSRPALRPVNYNFACPRVGNKAFVAAYEAQPVQQDPETHSIRFQNTYDVVPCVPPEDLGYQHTPRSYLVAFHREDTLLDPMDLQHVVHNHSITNYAAVIREALKSPLGFFAHKDWRTAGVPYALTSEEPDPDTITGRMAHWKDAFHRFRLWLG